MIPKCKDNRLKIYTQVLDILPDYNPETTTILELCMAMKDGTSLIFSCSQSDVVNVSGTTMNILHIDRINGNRINIYIYNCASASNHPVYYFAVCRTVGDVKQVSPFQRIGTETWKNLTLLNNWVNFGGGYSTAQYRKENDRVYLRGLIKGGTYNSIAFNIPTGYRPLSQTTATSVGSTGYGLTPAQIVISPTSGNAVLRWYTTDGTKPSSWINLDGISYAID